MKSKATLSLIVLIGISASQPVSASTCAGMARALGKLSNKETLQHNLAFYRELLTNINTVMDDQGFTDQQKRNYSAYQLRDLKNRIDSQMTQAGATVLPFVSGCNFMSSLAKARKALTENEISTFRSLVDSGISELDAATLEVSKLTSSK